MIFFFKAIVSYHVFNVFKPSSLKCQQTSGHGGFVLVSRLKDTSHQKSPSDANLAVSYI